MFFRRHILSLSCSVLLVISMIGWWNSTRYSERHLFRLGNFTIDTFSASSLLRISFVKGPIAGWGMKTNYRQPNPRGKFRFYPTIPTFINRNATIFEITAGFWHLAAIGVAMVTAALSFEIRKVRRHANGPE